MMVFLIVALVVVVGIVVAVVVGKVGSDTMSEPNRTSSFELPAGPLGSTGIESLKFDQSLRGYNMAQVDAVLERLREELRTAEANQRSAPVAPPRAEPADGQPEPDVGSIVPFRNRRREQHADDR